MPVQYSTLLCVMDKRPRSRTGEQRGELPVFMTLCVKDMTIDIDICMCVGMSNQVSVCGQCVWLFLSL